MLRLAWLLAELAARLWAGLRGLPRRAALALGGSAGDIPADPRRLWIVFAIALPVALAASVVLPRITLVMSASIEAWAVREAPGPIHRGDYVRFSLSHPVAGPLPVSVTKHALCLPGDRLTRIETPSATLIGAFDGHYFCNGTLLGVSLPVGPHGMRLQHMQWSGIIPAGMFYVGSHHPRGFDSRYIGLIPESRLMRMERLL
ncbi:MAG: S26 family signal peptidase [Sphingobium sp.]|nr:S26 family signal peptidase [Sphingobium sp.]